MKGSTTEMKGSTTEMKGSTTEMKGSTTEMKGSTTEMDSSMNSHTNIKLITHPSLAQPVLVAEVLQTCVSSG